MSDLSKSAESTVLSQINLLLLTQSDEKPIFADVYIGAGVLMLPAV